MDASVATFAQGEAAAEASGPARWLLLVHQIPPKPDYFRVKVRRRLARLGAVALKSTVYALPLTPETFEDFEWLRREIADEGGHAIVCEAHLITGMADAGLQELFRVARDADYDEIAADATAALSSITRRPLNDDERREMESTVARLGRRLREVIGLDFFGSMGRIAAENSFAALADRVSVASGARVREDNCGGIATGRIWVTRRGVFVDRIASAWLIRTFIDADATFKFVAGAQYRPEPGELRFDMFEGEYMHVGDRCTFEVLLDRFGMAGDAALRAIAEIVHDIDIKDAKFSRPEAAGVEQLLSGLVRATPTDEERLMAGGALFRSLYESFRDASATLSVPAHRLAP